MWRVGGRRWNPPTIHSRLNAERPPAYHHLDVLNLYARTNLFGFAYTEDPLYPIRRPIDNAGLLPTFGFSVEW